MNVLVIGAGGIIGQHMMVNVPDGVEAVFTRRAGDGVLYTSLEMSSGTIDWMKFLNDYNPDVVVNLAGESNTDVVEKDPEAYRYINVTAPALLRTWCDDRGKHLIHVSSQAVLDPVNEYGKQKLEAETVVSQGDKWTIVRPTFVLGIRPFPAVGRKNPAERILEGDEAVSVNDRYFSISFAWDVAEFLWELVVTNQPARRVLQVGNPETFSRLKVARMLGASPDSIRHDSLMNHNKGMAQRPLDTTYRESWSRETSVETGFTRLEMEFECRKADNASHRSKEIAGFLGRRWTDCLSRLNAGFVALHHAVADDFRKANPEGDEALLDWYRKTEAYIWELTAYHLDTGFNYKGVCKGIVDALKAKGVKRVLCLGDGVGSLTIALRTAGLDPWYHDLFDSETANFALARMVMRFGEWPYKNIMTTDFTPLQLPERMERFDAVVSLDFLEHVPNVEAWVRTVYESLKPGGWFVAQNGFNMGSGPQGSIPMHLSVNDHYERDWDPLLFSLGFTQEASNWYRRPE